MSELEPKKPLGGDWNGLLVVGGLSLLAAAAVGVRATYAKPVEEPESAQPVQLFVNCIDNPYDTDTWTFPKGSFEQTLRIKVGREFKTFTVRRDDAETTINDQVLTAQSLSAPIFEFSNLVLYPGRAYVTGEFELGDQAVSLACPAAVSPDILR